jgi:3,4-dihydroxy 2-butanone 4-phosphate synthase / GTP cyclohydrolase II
MPEFSSPEELIADIKAGELVILVDDADRENEGDLVAAAETITPAQVNFMATHGRGLICAPLSEKRVDALKLPIMVAANRESHGTAFTVSVDAATGITTGISAHDRARTLNLLGDPSTAPDDLVQPGHIFPLQARQGGVLRRAGHTEAAIDLVTLAGLQPAGVICEILNEDGSMSRLPQLHEFAARHSIKIGTIKDLIEFRREREKLVEREESIQMPTDFGTFTLHLYRSLIDGQHHLALSRGTIDDSAPVLVRVHSECLTGDVFASRRCDCGSQLHAALKKIDEEGRGVLLYMRQEGRGIGLAAKIHAYKLQEQGYDTVEANQKLGFAPDLRDYGIGAQILYDLGIRRIRLMTNNPRKVVGLDAHRLQIVERVPITSAPLEENTRYLDTKRDKLGHLF